MKTVCTINTVKLRNSAILTSQTSVLLYIISQSLLDTRRNLMGFFLSQPKKSPWQTSTTQNSKSQESCFIPQRSIFTAWTIRKSHIQIVVIFFGRVWLPRPDSLLRLLASAATFWGMLCIKPRSNSCYVSVQDVRALTMQPSHLSMI